MLVDDLERRSLGKFENGLLVFNGLGILIPAFRNGQ
jgi:hypothetical protein